jgi:hypothetical protein
MRRWRRERRRASTFFCPGATDSPLLSPRSSDGHASTARRRRGRAGLLRLAVRHGAAARRPPAGEPRRDELPGRPGRAGLADARAGDAVRRRSLHRAKRGDAPRARHAGHTFGDHPSLVFAADQGGRRLLGIRGPRAGRLHRLEDAGGPCGHRGNRGRHLQPARVPGGERQVPRRAVFFIGSTWP